MPDKDFDDRCSSATHAGADHSRGVIRIAEESPGKVSDRQFSRDLQRKMEEDNPLKAFLPSLPKTDYPSLSLRSAWAGVGPETNYATATSLISQ